MEENDLLKALTEFERKVLRMVDGYFSRTEATHGVQLLKLKESEKRYSNLFHASPLPMWVYDIETLRFVQVNNAAIKHYGYTETEFLNI